MKIEEITSVKGKEWKPIELKLTIDSVEEARLLFHVLNRSYLSKAIITPEYPMEDYSKEIAQEFTCIPLFLENLINEQGFEV